MDNNQKKNQFGIAGIGIPAEILFNPEITVTEKFLFGFIRLLAQSSRGCFASNFYLSQFLFCSQQTITNGISNLKRYQYIDIDYEKTSFGTIRHIFINTKYQEKYRFLSEIVHNYIEEMKSNDYGKDDAPLLKNLYGGINQFIGGYKPVYTNKDNNNDSDAKASLNGFSCENLFFQLNISFKRNRFPLTIKTLLPEYSIKRGTAPYRFVELWNNGLGHHTKHNLSNKTKTLDKIKAYFNQLRAGKFFKNKTFSPDWLRRNPKVSERINFWQETCYQFTEVELITGVKAALLYTMEGYWPPDKKNVPNSFLNMLYNPRSSTSWFVKALVCPAEPLRDQIQVNEFSPLYNSKMLNIGGAERTPSNIRIVDSCVRKLESCWRLTVLHQKEGLSYGDFVWKYQSWEYLVDDYIDWVENAQWIDVKSIQTCFSVRSGILRRWFDELRSEYAYGDEDFKVHSE